MEISVGNLYFDNGVYRVNNKRNAGLSIYITMVLIPRIEVQF